MGEMLKRKTLHFTRSSSMPWHRPSTSTAWIRNSLGMTSGWRDAFNPGTIRFDLPAILREQIE